MQQKQSVSNGLQDLPGDSRGPDAVLFAAAILLGRKQRIAGRAMEASDVFGGFANSGHEKS